MAQPVLLALETSSPTASAALGLPGGAVLSRTIRGQRRGSADLFPMIQDLLAEAAIDAAAIGLVAFSRGPGSFTGLRLGATIARTLHEVTGCRVIAIDSLEAIAETAAPVVAVGERVLPLVDARQGRLYGTVYAREGASAWSAVDPLAVRPLAEWLARVDARCWRTGEGIATARQECAASGARVAPDELWTPRAAAVLSLARRASEQGRFCAPNEIAPLYVRPPECEEVYEQRRAEAIRKRRESP